VKVNVALKGLMGRIPLRARIFLRQNWAVSGLAAIVVVVVLFGSLYEIIAGSWRKIQSSGAESKVATLLDRQLDRYLSRLVPSLRSFGFTEADFKDSSPRASSASGTLRSRTAEKTVGAFRLRAHAFMGVSGNDMMRISDNLARGFYANSGASLTTTGSSACSIMGEFVLAGYDPQPEYKLRFDLLKGSSAQNTAFKRALEQSCQRNLQYEDSKFPKPFFKAGPTEFGYQVSMHSYRGAFLKE
jgi:hypothetical protein